MNLPWIAHVVLTTVHTHTIYVPLTHDIGPQHHHGHGSRLSKHMALKSVMVIQSVQCLCWDWSIPSPCRQPQAAVTGINDLCDNRIFSRQLRNRSEEWKHNSNLLYAYPCADENCLKCHLYLWLDFLKSPRLNPLFYAKWPKLQNHKWRIQHLVTTFTIKLLIQLCIHEKHLQ